MCTWPRRATGSRIAVELINIVMVAANLLLTLALLVLILKAARGAAGSSTGTSVDARAALGEVRQDLSAQRIELQQVVAEGHKLIDGRVQLAVEQQASLSERNRIERQTASDDLKLTVDAALRGIVDKLHGHSSASQVSQAELRQAIEDRFDGLRQANDLKLEQVRSAVTALQASNTAVLKENVERIQALTDSNATKHVELQSAMQAEMEKLRQSNEAKLEKMRETVDEKLQGTLEKRLGESFALVSERLEQVQKGLGEMQTLASDVGGLKRVLTNVKSRGSWGEVQLERQLEDMLTADQFERNVNVKPSTRESVEFAVKMPGRDDDSPVYLPIDSKFPQEDYERLLQAQEAGEKTAVEAAAKLLERAIILQAKSIASKYVNPPITTDFAILYLPTEGLFAEVIRQPGLASRLQNDHRVLITGPTTLMSLLNSLQMGFRTLALEKRSSEVWTVLSAAKGEFQKYGAVWDKLEKQLQTAQNTVGEAGRRTRAVERTLRSVESAAELPVTSSEIVDADTIAALVGVEVENDDDSAS